MANKMAAKNPEPKSKNSAIFPLSRRSTWSSSSWTAACTNDAMTWNANNAKQTDRNEVFFI